MANLDLAGAVVQSSSSSSIKYASTTVSTNSTAAAVSDFTLSAEANKKYLLEYFLLFTQMGLRH